MRSGSKHVTPRAVMVHGAGGGGWEWTIWRRVFEAHGWIVRAPDLLPASAGLAATRVEDYVRQVIDWTNPDGACQPASETTNQVLIGASLGGLLALLAAGCTQASALVLINPLPPAAIGAAAMHAHVRLDYPDIVAWGARRSFASTARALADADVAARLFAFRRWRDESGAVLRAAHHVRADPPHCPSLLLASEYDADVSARTSRALARACGTELRLLRGASHVGPLLGRCAGETAKQALNWCMHALLPTSPE